MKCMGAVRERSYQNARFFLDLQFIPSAYPSRGTASRMRMLAAAWTSIPNAACRFVRRLHDDLYRLVSSQLGEQRSEPDHDLRIADVLLFASAT